MLKKSGNPPVVSESAWLRFVNFIFAAIVAAIVIILCLYFFRDNHPMPGGGADVIEMPSSPVVSEAAPKVESRADMPPADSGKYHLSAVGNITARVTLKSGAEVWLTQDALGDVLLDAIEMIKDDKLRAKWIALHDQLRLPLDAPSRYFYAEPIFSDESGLEDAGMGVGQVPGDLSKIQLKISGLMWGDFNVATEKYRQAFATTLVHELQHIEDRRGGKMPAVAELESNGYGQTDYGQPGPIQDLWLRSIVERFASEARAWDRDMRYIDQWSGAEDLVTSEQRAIFDLWKAGKTEEWWSAIYDLYYEKIYFPPVNDIAYDRVAMKRYILAEATKKL